MLSWFGRLLVRATAGAALLVVVGGTPALLINVVGWPLPHNLPTTGSLATVLTGTVTDHMVLNALAIAIWLAWALFVQAVYAELRDAVRGIRSGDARPHGNPMRGFAAMLVSSMLLGTVLAGSAATANPAPAAANPVPAARPAAALTEHLEFVATVRVGDQDYSYVVKRGDNMSKIAKEWLGDPDRWHEICQLNNHKHFPRVGGTLRDCNLIYPGWDLQLPTDAHPPTGARPVTPPQPPTPSPTTVPPAPPVQPPANPAPITASPRPAPTPVVTAPTGNPTGIPASTPPAAPSSAPASHQPASPSASASVDDAPARHGNGATSDEHGVQLSPLSWLPWSLAALISAAAAVVWLQRRRRYTGEPDDDPPTELPPPVVAVRRAITRTPELPPDITAADQITPTPDPAVLPPGGTGIVGDGAPAAARAALVTLLASGSPQRPDARGEVVIDAATLATLLGPDVVTLGPWPRLHVADTVDDALTAIEAQLLHRSRILDEHALTDLDELQQTAPDEEALPPVLLITETPPPGARMRAKVTLALGGGLRVSALLLGDWAHGPTVKIAPDGHTTLTSGQPTEPIPGRMPVLEPAAAIQILTTLREAQTGEPPAIASPAVPVTVVALHASRTAEPVAGTDTASPSTPTAHRAARARLCVLGPPRIEDITADGRPLRAKALELAVYLAVHPDGASTREIGEYLEPDARISQADQRVHTNASNLRHVLGRAGTADPKSSYIIKTAGRYRLDPATVDVDVWTLRDLLRKSTIASGPHRRELLTAACDLYTGPLAQGHKYDWIDPHRETVRRWGTEAHLQLADDLLDNDPHAASALLDKAIGLDRYSEALYVKAMHARHALGDVDGIRALLRALTKALADADAEPREETITLANQLRTSLDEK